MGADGGVCWVPLRRGLDEAEGLRRAAAALEPWWYDLTSLGSWQEDSKDEWIDGNADVLDRCIFGGYGTDRPCVPTLDELRDWIDTLEEHLRDPAWGLDPERATWGDWLLERDTRPSWCAPGRSWEGWVEGLRDHEAVHGEVIVAWIAEVRAVLDLERAGSVETWT